MLGEMTAQQLADWREFAREEPFGFQPQAELVSLLCSVVAASAPFRSGSAPPPSAFRWTPGKAAPEAEEEGEFRDVLGASDTTGPDLSRPLPDDD